ncbi:MAG: phosphoglucosamine mutase [Bacillota bacterium]
MSRLFGTDGVRGVANKELTPELAFKLGRTGAWVLAQETKHTPKIIVGCDTRISCDMLESALVAGICSVGATAMVCGVVPTPAIAYLVKKYGCDAGVVISASHNPYDYNGIKFFSSEGHKLPDSIENEIEETIHGGEFKVPSPTGAGIGVKIICEDALVDYVDFVQSTIITDLRGMKVALDCANGAVSEAAPMLFERLGISTTVLSNSPNGTNINDNCGSTHMQTLCETVKNGDFDLGIAFDGDADRMLACDANGAMIDGDVLMAIVAKDLKERGMLKLDTIVVTVMSNIGLDVFAKENGIKTVKTKVGDRYVLEEMLCEGYSIGGEQSGHIILLDHNTTGDGLLNCVALLQVIKRSGISLSENAKIIQIYPQVLVNAKVSNKIKYGYLEVPEIAEMCKQLEEEFHGEGRVLIRPSGTEPLVRVMIEGKDQEFITSKATELAVLIEKHLQG